MKAILTLWLLQATTYQLFFRLSKIKTKDLLLHGLSPSIPRIDQRRRICFRKPRHAKLLNAPHNLDLHIRVEMAAFPESIYVLHTQLDQRQNCVARGAYVRPRRSSCATI